MSKRNILLFVTALLAVGGLVLAGTFTWTAGGSTNDWDECHNWSLVGKGTCYPQEQDTDDAIFPSQGGPWSVNLTEATFDDLTIEADVTFGIASSPPWLSVDSLVVVGHGSSGTCGPDVNDAGTCLTFDVGTLLAARGQ